MKKILLLLPFLLILIVPLLALAPAQEKQPAEQPIKIILIGDIMLDRGVKYMIDKEGNGDFKFPFLKIADYLQTADIVFGNLEGPISDKGTKVGSIYSFRMDPRAIDGLKFANINVVSLANNHTFDYGQAALDDTVLRLTAAGIEGLGNGSSVIKNIRGTKIAFLAYTAFGVNGITEDDFNAVSSEIKTTKQNADILIVALHAGEEYQTTPNQFQVDFFQMAKEAGADFVFGHHPHVVQPNFYSLGNFVFDQNFSTDTMAGEIVELSIDNGIIKEVVPISIKINNSFQPERE